MSTQQEFYHSVQQHVGHESHGGQLAPRIEHLYAAHAEALADAQQMRARHDLAILNWPEKIDLHLGGGDGTAAVKVAGQADAYGRVGEGRQHATVYHSGAVAKMIAHRTLDSHAIGMPVDNPDSDQLVKG